MPSLHEIRYWCLLTRHVNQARGVARPVWSVRWCCVAGHSWWMEHAALHVRYYQSGVKNSYRHLYFRVGRARAVVCSTDHVECLVVPPRCDLPVERAFRIYVIIRTPDPQRAVFPCLERGVPAAIYECACNRKPSCVMYCWSSHFELFPISTGWSQYSQRCFLLALTAQVHNLRYYCFVHVAMVFSVVVFFIFVLLFFYRFFFFFSFHFFLPRTSLWGFLLKKNTMHSSSTLHWLSLYIKRE